MFNLIITIISIALIAAVAIASTYYGGSAFTEGTAKANAATVVSQAQQIAAANVLFKNDNSGTDAANVAALQAGGYLQSAPVLPTTIGASLDLNNGDVESILTNAKVCDLINKQLDPQVESPLASLGTKQYGCVTVGTEPAVMTFQYKG